MPLAAVSYKSYDGTEVVSSVEELLAESLADPLHPWPYPILRSMFEEDLTRPDSISMTALLKPCIRCVVLQAYLDYTEPVENMWARWKGTMYHSVMENYGPPGGIQEVRFWASLNGAELHGKPDLIYPALGVLVDLKTTRSVPLWDKCWNEHNQQLQMYRWLVNNATATDVDPNKVGMTREAFLKYTTEIKFTRMGIWYADSDKVKPLEVRKSVDVPTKPGAKNAFKSVRVPEIWSDDEVIEFIWPRHTALQEAFDLYETKKELPPFPDEMDIETLWLHRYSPVAGKCKLHHYTGNL